MRLTAELCICTSRRACLLAFLVVLATGSVHGDNIVAVSVTPFTHSAARNWKHSFSPDGIFVTYEDLLYGQAHLRLAEQGREDPIDIDRYVHGDAVLGEYTATFQWHPEQTWFAGSVAERGNYNLILFRLRRPLLRWLADPYRITRTSVSDADGWQGDARFFADGSRLVYVSGERGNGDIVVCDLPRCRPVFLTEPDAMDYAPDVSPAGKIVFTSRRDGVDALYLADPDSGVVRRITDGVTPAAYGVFVDDERVIAYQRDTLVEISVSGGRVRALAEKVLLEQRPAIDREGRRIAYVENRSDSKPLMIVDRRTGETRLLDTGLHYHERPVWHPYRSALLVQAFNGLQWDLYMVDVP